MRPDVTGSVFLEVTGLVYIDSGGLAALYQLLDSVPEGAQMVLISPRTSVLRTLEISGLMQQPRVRVISLLDDLQTEPQHTLAGEVTGRSPKVDEDEARAAENGQEAGAASLPTPAPYAATEAESLRMEVPPDLTALSSVREFVEEVAARVALGQERVYNLKLAVSEACANAVEHGMGDASAIVVSAVCGPDALKVLVEGGRDFRVRSNQQADERGHHRGLGIPLMVALIDEVRIGRSPGGGTAVELTLFLNGGDAHPA